MLIFEFRAPDLFQLVAELLHGQKIACVLDPGLEPGSPGYIFVFGDGATPFAQRQALLRARELEREDRLRPEPPGRVEVLAP